MNISILPNSFFKYSRISSANVTCNSSDGKTNAKTPSLVSKVFALTKNVVHMFFTDASVRFSFECISLLNSICLDVSMFFLI